MSEDYTTGGTLGGKRWRRVKKQERKAHLSENLRIGLDAINLTP
jgi:hypothetical protein